MAKILIKYLVLFTAIAVVLWWWTNFLSHKEERERPPRLEARTRRPRPIAHRLNAFHPYPDLAERELLLMKEVKTNKTRACLTYLFDPACEKILQYHRSIGKTFFPGVIEGSQLSKMELMCKFNKVPFKVLEPNMAPFEDLQIGRIFPSQNITELYKKGFKSCALVSSAGAMRNSSLGKEIDSHDVVLRFNHAPVSGYENDVGSKTTIRIINSVIMEQPRFNFTSEKIYQNVTKLLWITGPLNGNLYQFYKEKRVQKLFQRYWNYRLENPDENFFFLHPSLSWDLWKILQANVNMKIPPHVPTSGLIGIILLMNLCEQVHVYEFVPSDRLAFGKYYYQRSFDPAYLNMTLNDKKTSFHPWRAEKEVIRRLNFGTESDIANMGRVTLPGFRQISCGQ